MENLAPEVHLRGKFILSIPSTGTHALAKHLGFKHLTMIRNVTSAVRRRYNDGAGHVWNKDHRKQDGILLAEEWIEALEGYNVYMPVRDPAELAHSWPNCHARSLEQLRCALGTACQIIDARPVNLVDIRPLEVANRRGDGGRDEVNGRQLLKDFPQYFGDYYGR